MREPAIYITVKMIGTYGLLDLPEKQYAVLNINDVAERAKELIISYGVCYPNYGWSLIVGVKDDRKISIITRLRRKAYLLKRRLFIKEQSK